MDKKQPQSGKAHSPAVVLSVPSRNDTPTKGGSPP